MNTVRTFGEGDTVYVRIIGNRHWRKGEINAVLDTNEYQMTYNKEWDRSKWDYIYETDVFENDITNPTIIAEDDYCKHQKLLSNEHANISTDSSELRENVILEGRDCANIWHAFQDVFITHIGGINEAMREGFALEV